MNKLTLPLDTQARRVRLLNRLERREARMTMTIGRLQRLRNRLRPLLTRLRMGEDVGVIEAELRRIGHHGGDDG